MFSILTEQANVRDVILFPLMKPEFKNEDTPVLVQVETTTTET
jgi:hypothetical protein